MDITIQPGLLAGALSAIPSKSQAHRYLICAAFADNETELICPETNRDIEATAGCLRSLGARISRTANGYQIKPIARIPDNALLPCGESGSTLRFMLPIVGALGVDATFRMEGRLPNRPLSPLWEEMERMGCILTRPTDDTVRCCGKLRTGEYVIDGGVSSQFITGLLFAAALMDGESHITVTGTLESKPYVDMTKQALALFKAPRFHSPGIVQVEGDWSNAAFFLAAKKLGNQLQILGLNPESVQGDRAVAEILSQLQQGILTVSAADIPDLVPVLAIVAAVLYGAEFTQIRRLRLKESDRVATTVGMINALGGHAEATDDTLTVFGTGLRGGTVDAVNDHRIAMAAAVASTACREPVRILGAECVQKSYPAFWDVFQRLGGRIWAVPMVKT